MTRDMVDAVTYDDVVAAAARLKASRHGRHYWKQPC